MNLAAWRARPLLWGIPLVFLLINLGLFIFYRIAYAGQVEVLQDRFESEIDSYERLKEQRQTLETYLDRVKDSSDGIGELYLSHFSTEAERFTSANSELKNLARSAGLDPSSFSYPTESLGDMDLHRQGFTFTVDGTYDQLRRFINFLELSDHFFVLEQVSLNSSSADRGRADPRLTIGLAVSTVFTGNTLARRTAAEVARRAQRQDAEPEPGDETVAPAAIDESSDEEDAPTTASVDDSEDGIHANDAAAEETEE